MDELELLKAKIEAIRILAENDELEAIKTLLLEDSDLSEVEPEAEYTEEEIFE